MSANLKRQDASCKGLPSKLTTWYVFRDILLGDRRAQTRALVTGPAGADEQSPAAGDQSITIAKSVSVG